MADITHIGLERLSRWYNDLSEFVEANWDEYMTEENPELANSASSALEDMEQAINLHKSLKEDNEPQSDVEGIIPPSY